MHLICVNLQREVYPRLLLFPAGRKNETVSYEGDMIVSDIIKFLAAHGSHVMDLITNQGNCKNNGALSCSLAWIKYLLVFLFTSRIPFNNEDQFLQKF